MKVAIVGSGIAGLVAAHRLNESHEVTLYEANDYLGGHTNTIDVNLDGRTWPVDTGFIVFNDRTYPNFCNLLRELGVASQPTRMTFSVSCRDSGLEYCGGNLNEVFAQRRNLFRPSFHRMLRDILRFNREARRLLDAGTDERTLGEFLYDEAYGTEFVRDYIVPMAAAIWSTDQQRMLEFPARHFVRFFENHGLLQLRDRPQWRTVCGGSRSYIDKIIQRFDGQVRLSAPVRAIRRQPDGVEIVSGNGDLDHFDKIFIAAHSDQALALLESPSDDERDILGSIPYQSNTAVLHTDPALLPKRRLARAAWNYVRNRLDETGVALTYWMNLLQSLDAPEDLCVTVNRDDDIDPARIIRRISYAHPVFTPAGVAAQKRSGDINGANHTYYCGAYWGYGFHEDGVVSALTALAAFERDNGNAQLHLRRTG